MLTYNTYEDPGLPLGRRWVSELTVWLTPESADETEVFRCAGGFPRVRAPPSSLKRKCKTHRWRFHSPEARGCGHLLGGWRGKGGGTRGQDRGGAGSGSGRLSGGVQFSVLVLNLTPDVSTKGASDPARSVGLSLVPHHCTHVTAPGRDRWGVSETLTRNSM
jgi:hypothetical protein